MTQHIKNFVAWFGLKQKLDAKIFDAPYVSEGDVWWISFGENVGQEISGKNQSFLRPGIIYKKFSSKLFFVIPITTKHQDGSWFIPFNYKKRNMIACLHQARSIDYRRLFDRMGTIGPVHFQKVKMGFEKLYK